MKTTYLMPKFDAKTDLHRIHKEVSELLANRYLVHPESVDTTTLVFMDLTNFYRATFKECLIHKSDTELESDERPYFGCISTLVFDVNVGMVTEQVMAQLHINVMHDRSENQYEPNEADSFNDSLGHGTITNGTTCYVGYRLAFEGWLEI